MSASSASLSSQLCTCRPRVRSPLLASMTMCTCRGRECNTGEHTNIRAQPLFISPERVLPSVTGWQHLVNLKLSPSSMHLHSCSLISITGLPCTVCRQGWNAQPQETALMAKASAAATSVAVPTFATCPGITMNALAIHEHLQLDPTTDSVTTTGSRHPCYLSWSLLTELEGPLRVRTAIVATVNSL